MKIQKNKNIFWAGESDQGWGREVARFGVGG